MSSVSSEYGCSCSDTESYCGTLSFSGDVSDIGSGSSDLFSPILSTQNLILQPLEATPVKVKLPPVEDVDAVTKSLVEDLSPPVEAPVETVTKSPVEDLSLSVEAPVEVVTKSPFEDLSVWQWQGVGTAQAVSNSIITLSASVFREIWRLEPFTAPTKAMWCKELEQLVCVGSIAVDPMVPRPQADFSMHIDALKEIDRVLLSILDNFREAEFLYNDSENMDNAFHSLVAGGRSVRKVEEYWLPILKFPLQGLSEVAKKGLQSCRGLTNQILKAGLVININVLAAMEVPPMYWDFLPKNGKACLGDIDIIYQCITAKNFSEESLLDCLDLSSLCHALNVANRIEAALHAWKLKERNRNSKRKVHISWGHTMKDLFADGLKNQVLSQRAEMLLNVLRHQFPRLQTILSMNKIQYNKDVGQSILESYSRAMVMLASDIMAKIDGVLHVDDDIKCSNAESSFIRRDDIIRWVDKRMPISCGNFKLAQRRAMRYDDTDLFSHEIKVQYSKGNPVYTILPQTGDIWALYKSWSEKLEYSELASCEYEIVEFLEKNEVVIEVMVLEKVDGYMSVFRPQIQGNSKVTMVIPCVELLRFSHQVPAFRLSDEKEGSLRGFWETDVAALPSYLFSSN